jgi:hypothetical protein
VSEGRRDLEHTDELEPHNQEEEDLEEFEDDSAYEEEGSEEDEADSSGNETSDQASLDELLAQRAASRRGTDASDDEADIMAFPSGTGGRLGDRRPTRLQAIRDRQEFVCSRCRLVKPRVQLADEARGLCRDCA